MILRQVCTGALTVAIVATALFAQELTSEQKTKVSKKLEQLQVLGNDETVINEIKKMTVTPPLPEMNNTEWKKLTFISPQVKSLTKNELATYLKGKKDDSFTELFVSDTAGNKVALFAKTSSFCHKGKAKHDVPMSGKTWIGKLELDESTGKKQVQVSFPVLDGKNPIGSIVIGLDLSKL